MSAAKADLHGLVALIVLIQHGHAHEHLEHPGKFAERDLPDYTGRDWNERAFTIGIGGYAHLMS